jgi:hypothetical protein
MGFSKLMLVQYFSLKVLGSSGSSSDFGDMAITGVPGSLLSLSLLFTTRKKELAGE